MTPPVRTDPAARPTRGGPVAGRVAPRGNAAPAARTSAPRRRVVTVPPPPARSGSRGRMRFVAVALVLVLVVFAGRLVYVQGLKGADIAAEARHARLKSVSLLGTRGSITDANGVALASSVERYDISVNQQRIDKYRGFGKHPDGVLGAAEVLAPVLGMDVKELGGLLVGTRSFKYLKKGVEPTVAREVRALGLDGINVDKVADRVYPNGTLAGNVVGYVNSAGMGLAGLEATLDDRLAGKPGEEVYEGGAKAQPIPGGFQEGTAARDGDSVRLTLLSDVQWRAQSDLQEALEKTGASSGSVVVWKVKTGEILALADSGTVDPNKPGDATGSLTSSVSDVFEPGSTGKVITMSAALEEGLVTPTSRFSVPDTITTDNDQTFHDAEPHGVERLTATGVLAQSSNVGTIDIGKKLTVKQRYQWLKRFGFGQETGIELPAESAGLVNPYEKWDGRSKWAVLYGQSVSVTALQAAQVFATVANGGVRVQPHIIAGWEAPDGTYTPAPQPASTRVVSEKTADQVLKMLLSVVDDGTGSKAAIPGYQVAGKTGTAENWVNGHKGITASFIGAVPAEDPEIVVAVILHNPESSIFGGVVAAPVFSDVAGFTLGELGIAPSGKSSKLYPTTW